MNDNAVTIVCRAIADPAMQTKFREVLPPDVALDRFTRVTLTAIQKNIGILECDRTSLYNACVDAASRGLLPDGKEGALVSFNVKQGNEWIKKAQFMPMPEGVIKEMAKAGFKVHAASVYEKDQVEIWHDDSGQHIKHVPVVFGDRGERIGAVAWGQDRDGRTYVEAMNMGDLARVAAASRSKDKNGNLVGPWKDWPERMEQKSALHRLRKRVAILGDDDLAQRLRDDDDDLAPLPQPVAEPSAPAAEPEAPKKRPRGLQAVIDKAEDAETAPPDDEMIDAPDDGEVF